MSNSTPAPVTFHLDNDGYYVNTQEKRVQGFIYNDTGTSMVETLADIQIDQSNMVDPKGQRVCRYGCEPRRVRDGGHF